jgi:hypothetical protein
MNRHAAIAWFRFSAGFLSGLICVHPRPSMVSRLPSKCIFAKRTHLVLNVGRCFQPDLGGLFQRDQSGRKTKPPQPEDCGGELVES